MNLTEVTIQRSDTGAAERLHFRDDRIEAFKNLMWDMELLATMVKLYAHMIQNPNEVVMPGISGVANLGLGTIFTDIPSKFPIADLLVFLKKQDENCRDLYEVEKRLEVMANKYPALDIEGNDR